MTLFPSYRYHRTEEPRIVQTPEEDAALGEGWAHSPAHFECDDFTITEEDSDPFTGPGATPAPKPKTRKR